MVIYEIEPLSGVHVYEVKHANARDRTRFNECKSLTSDTPADEVNTTMFLKHKQ